MLKKDILIPEPFAKPQWSDNIIHDRSDLFHQIFRGFAKRIHHGEHLQATKDNPLVALQSAPGGSKSLSLDLFARLDVSVLDEVQRSELPPGEVEVILETLRASLPICITYNAVSTLQPDELSTFDAALSLICRMVFSSLFTGSFPKFYAKFVVSMRSATVGKNEILLNCLDALYLAARGVGKTSILLLVDELVKSGPEDGGHHRVFETCSAIGALLNEHPVTRFNAVLSSLSQIALFDVTKKSGRPIHWAYMRRPSVKESLRLFAHFESKVLEDEFRYIEWCCVDCGGHYQSMRCLAEAVNSLIRAKKPITYATLRSNMVGQFQKRDIDRDLVDAGLRSRSMRLSTILTSGKSVSKSIVDGDLLNVLENPALTESGINETIVPLLSPAVLWQWSVGELNSLDDLISLKTSRLLTMSAKKHRRMKESIEKLDKLKKLPSILLALLKLDDSQRGVVYWDTFQKFHSYWEAMYRDLHSQSTYMKEFYQGSHISPVFHNVRFEPVSKKSPFIKNVKSFREIQHEDLFDYIFLFERPSNFPAIDAISFERLESSQGTNLSYHAYYIVFFSYVIIVLNHLCRRDRCSRLSDAIFWSSSQNIS